MDIRNLIHHQNQNQSHHQPRYVPMPYPSPQSTTHYPDDPNFHNPRPQNPNHHYHQTYHHRQIHHHNVLQPQPQVTPHLAPPPMPRPISPQYNPNQPLFTVPPPNQNLPFEFERIQRPCHWVSHRIPIDDDRLGRRLPYFDHACSGNRSDIKDASRAMVVSRQEWSYDFDSDTRFHFQNKTMSPYGVTDRLRHDAVGSSRFKREYNVGFESKHREEMRVADEENHARKGQCVLSSDACFRDPELVSDSSSSVRNLELKSGSYSGHYCVAYEDELYKRGGSDEMNENARWSHDTKSPRDVHSSSSFEKGCAVVSNGDWAHILTSKREYYGSEPGRYGNSGSREVNHEFIWNPRKQVQKKSVLLRIQKPNHKNTVPPKLGKPATKTLVWTLRGTKSSANDHSSLRHQRGFPRLFPWKRTTFWKNFTQYRNLISEATSLSPITRKLLLLRKRDTIYIRSTNGYSLRKSNVLSVGGSSLKWSKFIEKRAKQANEEATLAVAAAKRKKREKNGVAFAGSGLKNRKLSSRERIFCIGSDRYKMDPSRRTLQRISDNESSDSASVQTDKVARRSYIPRRLVIGNDEYVQVGNGNQLIRDPKRRTRLLASEKVRSSLHTVRLRLARKRKYCQFFPRFGKCNKDDGKCPYIHDPSKIAVCTKYLNSLCSNPNCKLTHKVIPERMPDCSYFLQGLCTNESCPYRHVNVNPKASICEGFLRGYCADGNECRKKHSYVCPTFQATRTCSQGSKCKLHHPMNRTGGKIRKRYIEPKNTRGRYFGSMRTNIAESRTSASDRQSSEDRSERCLEEGSDFISIDMDVSDDEEGESKDLMGKQTLVLESDPSKLQLDDRDELIKPVRIMH